jgi:hypothetical protein
MEVRRGIERERLPGSAGTVSCYHSGRRRHNISVGAAMQLTKVDIVLIRYKDARSGWANPSVMASWRRRPQKMEPNPDIGSSATHPPTDSGSGGSIAGPPVLESQCRVENAPHAAGLGWDPYEVWWTQVRAVQMARASKIHSPPPPIQHERRDRARPPGFSEAARNVMLTLAHLVASLKVRGVLHSIGYRRQ